MRRLKVDVDLDSGYVVLKLPVMDFREMTVAASLNCYDSLRRDEKIDNKEALAYHNGLLQFMKGIEALIDMQVRPYLYEDPIPLITKERKERRALVEQEKNERLLLDRIMEQCLAEARARGAAAELAV